MEDLDWNGSDTEDLSEDAVIEAGVKTIAAYAGLTTLAAIEEINDANSEYYGKYAGFMKEYDNKEFFTKTGDIYIMGGNGKDAFLETMGYPNASNNTTRFIVDMSNNKAPAVISYFRYADGKTESDYSYNNSLELFDKIKMCNIDNTVIPNKPKAKTDMAGLLGDAIRTIAKEMMNKGEM